MPQFMNRRSFLQSSGSMLAAGSLFGGASMPAQAANTSGYKALICVYLYGGMDQSDTVLPYDVANYDLLASVRPGLFSSYGVGSGNSSRDRQNLLQLNLANATDFPGRKFALPDELSDLHGMFNSGDMAIVGNVGPLIEPTDQDSFEGGSVVLPKRLFSHNDQQSTWMTLGVEGSQFGWGGRFADAVAGAGNPTFTSVSLSGSDAFLSGQNVRPFITTPDSAGENLNIIQNKWYTGYGAEYDELRANLQSFYDRNSFDHQSLLKRDHMKMFSKGLVNLKTYNSALEQTSPYDDAFPETGLGQQLRHVARTIAARSQLGTGRQVFFTSMGGFDTHSNQQNSLPNLHRTMSQAFKAFRDVMISQGMWNNVTLFTSSDFGRTTIDNGDGTDHGWGSHHFVLGGSVNGQRIYGNMPSPDLSQATYTRSSGRLIPTTSIEAYAGALGSWFGLTQSELNQALPNLSAWDPLNVV